LGIQTPALKAPPTADGHYVSDTIWLGKVNGIIIFEKQPVAWVAQIKAAQGALKAAHRDINILAMVKTLSNNPKVMWKNSIAAVIAKKTSTP
jgi:hypothetical protein